MLWVFGTEIGTFRSNAPIAFILGDAVIEYREFPMNASEESTQDNRDAALSDNKKLIEASRLSSESDPSIIGTTPYRKGIGFSVKRKYTDKIKRAFKSPYKGELFAFISLSIYSPSPVSTTGLGIAFLQITPARLPEITAFDGSVAPINDGGTGLPLPVSEDYHFDLKTNLLYSDLSEAKPITLSDAFTTLWLHHLCSVEGLTRYFLRFQLSFVRLAQKRYLIPICIIELIVWIFSGQSFYEQPVKTDNVEEDPALEDAIEEVLGGKRSKKDTEWVFAWLYRIIPVNELLADRGNQSIIIDAKDKSERVDFHGIKVSPIAVAWFYLVVIGFFVYRNISEHVGEMDFLNAYWNAILFFAPITVLGLSCLIPNAGKWMLNKVVARHLAIQARKSRQLTIKRFCGIPYFGSSSTFNFDKENYKW